MVSGSALTSGDWDASLISCDSSSGDCSAVLLVVFRSALVFMARVAGAFAGFDEGFAVVSVFLAAAALFVVAVFLVAVVFFVVVSFFAPVVVVVFLFVLDRVVGCG